MDPTAAPVDLTINDVTYQAHPFRDIDHETLNKWIRREYMIRVKEMLGDDEDIIQQAISRVIALEWMSKDGLQMIATEKGLNKFTSILCRGQSIPTFERSNEVLEMVMEAFTELHPRDEDEEPVEGSSNQPKSDKS